MGAIGVQAFGEHFEQFAYFVDVEFGAAGVERLDEAAHVRALEMLWQIYGQRDGRDGVLFDLRLVENPHRETEVFDAYAVDGDLAVIRLVLSVFEVGEFLG